jgi:DNA (cytosine-5)-methyltransferase 1
MKETKQSGKCFAEFFAGIGLMRVGLERAGWQIVFANDIDEDKQRMYRDHFGASNEFILGDVHKLGASEIPDIALATASFPCNDLSLAGARRGLAGEQSSALF